VGVGITIVDEPVTHIVAGGIIAILHLERAEDLSPAAEAILLSKLNAYDPPVQ
jgi:transcriptional regulator of NAD metabolism